MDSGLPLSAIFTPQASQSIVGQKLLSRIGTITLSLARRVFALGMIILALLQQLRASTKSFRSESSQIGACAEGITTISAHSVLC